MPTPNVLDFRKALLGAEPMDIVDAYLLADGAVHVSDNDISYIGQCLAAAYGVAPGAVEVVITGSAKLGFSLIEKAKAGEPALPRYRAFAAMSDIDVAVISAPIFNAIWHELSAHYHRSVWFPPETGRLGDYLVTGWLRPDKFPKNVRLPRCDAWRDLFRRLSANSRFKRRRLSGGAFYSREQLRQYLGRAVRECISLEEIP